MKVTLKTGDEIWVLDDEFFASGPSRNLLLKIANSLVKLYDTEAGNPYVRVLHWFAAHADGVFMGESEETPV
jgi:hypothetical protein